MKDSQDRFMIEVSEKGLTITAHTGESLTMAPVEALMLLDILQAEEGHLRKLADAQTPLPLRFSFSGS